MLMPDKDVCLCQTKMCAYARQRCVLMPDKDVCLCRKKYSLEVFFRTLLDVGKFDIEALLYHIQVFVCILNTYDSLYYAIFWSSMIYDYL